MNTSVYAGLLAGSVPGFLLLAGFFARAYSQRREEGEYLLFALLSASLSVYGAGLAWCYLNLAQGSYPEHFAAAADLGTLGAVPSVALGIHFAWRFARLPGERSVMIPAYALTGFYGATVLAHGWWASPHGPPIAVPILGGVVFAAPQYPTLIGLSFYGLALVSTLLMTGIFGRAVFRGNGEVLSSFLGSLFLSVAVVNDALVGAGRRVGLYLTPLGYMLFAFGVSLTLVSRYGLLSRQLEERGEDLQNRTRELRRSYKQLQKAQADLVRKEQLAVVGELAAVIAHEVRNPLAIIGNAVAGLRRSEIAPEDRATLLKIIDEEASRLNRLVSDLLCYARPVNPQRHLLDIRELLDRSLQLLLTNGYPDLRVEFVETDGPLPPVWADPGLLRQVFDNVIGNAIQAMHGDGTLTVRLRPEHEKGQFGLLINLIDTGEGMDTQVRSRARTPFFTTRPSGTGLGLAIVDRIVDAHGGTMTMESRAGEGTTVGIFLPEGSEEPAPRAAPDEQDAPLSGAVKNLT